MNKLNQHWNEIFAKSADSELGWFESDFSQTLKFLDLIQDFEIKSIFLPGAGTSRIVEELISRGYELILNDISEKALELLKEKLGEAKDSQSWICQDISLPFNENVPLVDFWIDRAVLHFILEEDKIKQYFENLKTCVKQGGYVLLAEFSLKGAKKCAGLELHQYSVAEMKERLGENFECIKYENFTYFNPKGDPRPYIYALFKKLG